MMIFLNYQFIIIIIMKNFDKNFFKLINPKTFKLNCN